jgi:hypothetical protein
MASRSRKPAKNYTGAKRHIIMDENIQFSKLIEENMDKGFQVRLVVNDFRETTYIQLRKYFLSYEGEWIPSREGVSIPASLENMRGIIDGMLDICARAEGEEIIQHYYNKIKDIE